MKWTKLPPSSGLGSMSRPRKTYYKAGDFSVLPAWWRGRANRQTKQVVYHLFERGHRIGGSFGSARLAKAFAEELEKIGGDLRRRREFIRDGASWTWALQDHFRSPAFRPDPREEQES